MSKILSLHLHLYLTKKVYFLKLVKTLCKIHFFWPLKNIHEKSVPRPYFLPHILNGAFSALSLLKSPLWLRLRRVFASDTFLTLPCLASSRRLLSKIGVSSRRNASFYIPLRMLNNISLSKICSFELETGLKPCYFTHF